MLYYSVVQTADWKFGATNTGEQPKYVRDSALATLVMCMLGLIGYTIYSVSLYWEFSKKNFLEILFLKF